MSGRYQMNPELEQAIGKMRSTHSNVEVLQALSAIQDRTEQATQVILASINIFDLEQRSEILLMLFELPRANDGLNATHFPLLVQLYVKSVQSPPMPLGLAQRRSFIQNEILNARLLGTFANLLHADAIRAIRSRGPPLPSLLGLLEESRGSSSLSATDHQMIEDAIIVVKKGMEDGGLEDITPTPVTPPPNPSVVQPPAPKKAHEMKPTTSAPSEEPTSSTPLSIIVALIVAATGLLWLLLKGRK